MDSQLCTGEKESCTEEVAFELDIESGEKGSMGSSKGKSEKGRLFLLLVYNILVSGLQRSDLLFYRLHFI